MRSPVSKFISWLAVGFAFLLACYVAGYFLTVKRQVVSTSGPPGDTYWMVAVDLRGPTTRLLFQPLLRLDRRYFRRHYWSEWYESHTPDGKTNIVYFVDLMKEHS